MRREEAGRRHPLGSMPDLWLGLERAPVWAWWLGAVLFGLAVLYGAGALAWALVSAWTGGGAP